MSCKYPDRWLDYTKYGSQVPGTQFIALKVPLAKRYFTKHQEDSFTPEDVVQEIPRLGLVIDLTFTAKYYNPSEFVHQNVQHKKIFTKGHEIPKRSLVNQFIRIVNGFLGDEQNKDKLIGVHCTHGLNRTGYFVCAYMILVQGQAPKAAINSFNDARAHPMERANYLHSLQGLIPLSYNSQESPGNNDDIHGSSGSRREQRRRHDHPTGNHRRERSRENHNGYYRDVVNNYRDRSVNGREHYASGDHSNNSRTNYSRDDRRPYRNYREFNHLSYGAWRDQRHSGDHKSTPRHNGENINRSSYYPSNGDRHRYSWVRKNDDQ